MKPGPGSKQVCGGTGQVLLPGHNRRGPLARGRKASAGIAGAFGSAAVSCLREKTGGDGLHF